MAVANTYYFGRLAASSKEEDQAVAAALKVFWPNQGEGDRGVHMNVSGVGITASAQNRESAIRLLEFLVSPEAQTWYAEVNHEYPVVPSVAASETLESFGAFNEDTLNLTALGANNRQAVELMDRPAGVNGVGRRVPNRALAVTGPAMQAASTTRRWPSLR